MKKIELAKKLIEELRSMDSKIDKLEKVSGFYIYEFLSELETIQFIVIDLLDVPPWDADEEIVYDYIRGRADYSFEEMLEIIEKARNDFDEDEWNDFCDRHERDYGSRP